VIGILFFFLTDSLRTVSGLEPVQSGLTCESCNGSRAIFEPLGGDEWLGGQLFSAMIMVDEFDSLELSIFSW